MKCLTCLKKFREGERVIAVEKYIVNSHRGDFVSNTNTEYVHHKCIAQADNG